MAGINSTTDIQCDTSKVFAFVCQVEQHSKWMEMVANSELTSGTAGQVGAKYKQLIQAMGQSMEGVLEIVEVEPNSRFRTRIQGGPMKVEQSIEVSPQGTGTKVKMTVDAGPMGALMGPMIRKQVEGGLVKLKALLEG